MLKLISILSPPKKIADWVVNDFQKKIPSLALPRSGIRVGGSPPSQPDMSSSPIDFLPYLEFTTFFLFWQVATWDSSEKDSTYLLKMRVFHFSGKNSLPWIMKSSSLSVALAIYLNSFGPEFRIPQPNLEGTGHR